MLAKLFDALQGRHTAFVVVFFITGTTLHIFHRLDATYIGFMTSLMAFVAGHSIQENYFNKDGQPSASVSTGDGIVVEQAPEAQVNK